MCVHQRLSTFAFVFASVLEACSSNPIHGTGPKDASEVTGRPAADAATLPDLVAPADRKPASDPPAEPAPPIYPDSAVDSVLYVATCGDGKQDWNEECDDRNIVSGDGCSSACKVEPGFRCSVPGQRCTGICGDGLVKGPETCDDGNTLTGDGCSNICLAEPGDFCGDGIVSGDEECDHGSTNSDSNYGGCSLQCRYVRCGDGILNGDEECDCGDNYIVNVAIPPCVLRATSWGPSFCFWCRVLPDIGG